LLAACILAAALVVLVMLVPDFGGKLPDRPRFDSPTTPVVVGPTNNRARDLFLPAVFAALQPATNQQSPFFTTYLRPKVPPPPPPVLTRKVNVTYDGLFITATGQKRAYVVVDGRMGLFPVGAAVVGDLMISNMDRTILTLNRAVTQEVAVPFRTSKEVEIPLK
jgi:hypothetical protein